MLPSKLPTISLEIFFRSQNKADNQCDYRHARKIRGANHLFIEVEFPSKSMGYSSLHHYVVSSGLSLVEISFLLRAGKDFVTIFEKRF